MSTNILLNVYWVMHFSLSNLSILFKFDHLNCSLRIISSEQSINGMVTNFRAQNLYILIIAKFTTLLKPIVPFFTFGGGENEALG